jgi:hypothetical protein
MAFVTALRDSLGEGGVGALPQRWVPVDPELTRPGNKPSLVPETGDLPEPAPPSKKKRRRWPAAVAALVLLAAGGLGGYALWRGTHGDVTFTDDDSTLSVTVPRSWSHDVSLSGWKPPDSQFNQSALAVGDRPDWRRSGQGVFVGLLPEDKLPRTMPRHPACSTVGKPDDALVRGDAAITVTSSGCPGVIIERVVRVSDSILLWVQVRGDDATTAAQVLDSVQTRGAL